MTSTIEKMPTGIPGLDHLLQGGIVRGNSLLIEGPPGSGKSTLAGRILYEGAVRYNEPGLLITFEEFPRQVYQEAANFGIDLQELEDAGKVRVIWTPPSHILQSFRGKNDLIEKIVKEMGARRLVIDSITHFKRVASSEVDLREILATILCNLKIMGVNPFLIKELEREDSETIAFEEYLVDASLRLHNKAFQGGGENTRYLEIRKTRGQGHVSGLHPFRLSADGLSVFPRMRPSDVKDVLPKIEMPQQERASFGVKELDEMLCGGVLPGTLTLVSGYPGTGKSVVGYHFLNEALKSNEPCLLLSLSDSCDTMLQRVKSVGMDWQEAVESGLLRVAHFHSVGLVVEEVFDYLIREIKANKPARFVIDPVGNLTQSVKDEERFNEYILVLASLLQNAGITSIFLHDTQGMGGEKSQESYRFINLSSCSIVLSMAETDGELRRFISIEKHAGSDHIKELREISIDSSGFHIHRKASGLSGILTGQTRGAMENVSGEVLPALDQVSKTLASLVRANYIPQPALVHLRDARQQIGLIDVVLREHFGETNIRGSIESMIGEKNKI